MPFAIAPDFVEKRNAAERSALDEDYASLGHRLARRSIDIEAITSAVAAFAVAVPTWGVGTGGTRFARFPGPGEPRGILDKLDDCATIQRLVRATPTVSPHFPWGQGDRFRGVAPGGRRARAGV